MTAPDAWIDLILKRGPELRKAGVLSIGCGGNSAVLAPLEPGSNADDADDKGGFKNAEPDESSNAWENASSYPSGHVPKLAVDDEELPPIPTFDEER